ncbi:hypothetical protein N9M09_03690 [Candidatus Poseidoniales archaeon]|nr:hypothetical protein [Candidatus Poseidoniales archaeon]
MRAKLTSVFLCMMFFGVLLVPTLNPASARSVHETAEYDLFPQGELSNPADWSLQATTSFTSQPATYTDTMVADQRITMVHQRPQNLDSMDYWGTNSPTESDNVVGSPDGLFAWSTGPVMSVDGFDFSASTQYVITSVDVLVAFKITDSLSIDSVRLSMDWSNGTDLMRTWSNTNGAVDHINNSAYRLSITSVDDWSWSMLSSIGLTMDYVSVGQTDDARLELDAIGIEVTMETAWYGGEVAQAISTASGHDMPIQEIDMSQGEYNGMSLSVCGLESTDTSTIGSWTSAALQRPAEQYFGRIHFDVNESGTEGNVSVQYATSTDGESFSDFAMHNTDALPMTEYLKVRVLTDTSCVTSVRVDVNDPTLSIAGRIYGDGSGIDGNYSRWTLSVGGTTVANLPVSVGLFNHEIPIGAYMSPGQTELSIMVKTWFTWDSDGSASTTALEVNSIDVSGGYDIFYDEDPVCQLVGDQQLSEDGGGIFVPLLTRCTDDRTDPTLLTVEFENSQPDLVNVSLNQGEVRVSLLSEQSGSAQILMTVSDEAGNSHVESFNIIVDSIDDAPVLNEFPSLVRVEHAVATPLSYIWSDVDTIPADLTISSNKTWVEVDLINSSLLITAPTPGYTSVELTLCDQTTCVDRVLDLDVRSLPDLRIESVVVGEGSADGTFVELTEVELGSYVTTRVYVANDGFINAEMVTIRCTVNGMVGDIATITTLEPGAMSIATCEFQVPYEGQLLRIEAIVDGGEIIDEGDETNNEGSVNLVLIEPTVIDDVSTDEGMSTTTIWIISILVLAAIIGGFTFFAPAKIRKYE